MLNTCLSTIFSLISWKVLAGFALVSFGITVDKVSTCTLTSLPIKGRLRGHFDFSEDPEQVEPKRNDLLAVL